MKCIYFQKSINSVSLSFHWSFHAFHKCALFISQGVRLTANLSNCHSTADFFLHILSFLYRFLWKHLRRMLLEKYFCFSDLIFCKFLLSWTMIHISNFFSKDSLWNCIQLLYQTNKQIQKPLDWLKNLLKHSQILV